MIGSALIHQEVIKVRCSSVKCFCILLTKAAILMGGVIEGQTSIKRSPLGDLTETYGQYQGCISVIV